MKQMVFVNSARKEQFPRITSKVNLKLMFPCLYRRVELEICNVEMLALYRRQGAYYVVHGHLLDLHESIARSLSSVHTLPSSGRNSERKLTELAGYALSIYTYIRIVGSEISKKSKPCHGIYTRRITAVLLIHF